MYLKNKYGKGVLAANDQYILLVEAGNKVSFAKDHLSLKVKRPTFCLDGVDIRVDTLENLIANKMSAFVSRFSRNDALDVMCLLRLAKDSREMAARMILGQEGRKFWRKTPATWRAFLKTCRRYIRHSEKVRSGNRYDARSHHFL